MILLDPRTGQSSSRSTRRSSRAGEEPPGRSVRNLIGRRSPSEPKARCAGAPDEGLRGPSRAAAPGSVLLVARGIITGRYARVIHSGSGRSPPPTGGPEQGCGTMINESSRGSFAANASAVLAVLGALGAIDVSADPAALMRRPAPPMPADRSVTARPPLRPMRSRGPCAPAPSSLSCDRPARTRRGAAPPPATP